MRTRARGSSGMRGSSRLTTAWLLRSRKRAVRAPNASMPSDPGSSDGEQSSRFNDASNPTATTAAAAAATSLAASGASGSSTLSPPAAAAAAAAAAPAYLARHGVGGTAGPPPPWRALLPRGDASGEARSVPPLARDGVPGAEVGAESGASADDAAPEVAARVRRVGGGVGPRSPLGWNSASHSSGTTSAANSGSKVARMMPTRSQSAAPVSAPTPSSRYSQGCDACSPRRRGAPGSPYSGGSSARKSTSSSGSGTTFSDVSGKVAATPGPGAVRMRSNWLAPQARRSQYQNTSRGACKAGVGRTCAAASAGSSARLAASATTSCATKPSAATPAPPAPPGPAASIAAAPTAASTLSCIGHWFTARHRSSTLSAVRFSRLYRHQVLKNANRLASAACDRRAGGMNRAYEHSSP